MITDRKVYKYVFSLGIMERMNLIEDNVIVSFNRVKADIIRLQDEFMQLRETQIRILEKLESIESRANESPQVIRVVESVKEKKVAKKKKSKVKRAESKAYLASKGGKKFHDPGCVSLKNVSKENLISYVSKNKAVLSGLQPCGTCIPL